MPSTPKTLAKNSQRFSVAARVVVELKTGPWPTLERRLLVRVGEVALLDEQVSDLARARALALLARLGLEDDDLKHLERAGGSLLWRAGSRTLPPASLLRSCSPRRYSCLPTLSHGASRRGIVQCAFLLTLEVHLC